MVQGMGGLLHCLLHKLFHFEILTILLLPQKIVAIITGGFPVTFSGFEKVAVNEFLRLFTFSWVKTADKGFPGGILEGDFQHISDMCECQYIAYTSHDTLA